MFINSFNKKRIVLTSIIILSVFLTACNGSKVAEPITRTKFALNTICSISIYDKAEDKIFEQCFDTVANIEKKMSVDIADSEVSKINSNAGIAAVAVSDDTFSVIKAGLQYGLLTNGKFDITVGPLVKLWAITKPEQKVPTALELQRVLPLIDYRKVIVDDAKKTIMLPEKGMALDLGGIAKGYAGDAVAAELRKNGIKHAIADLGGNLFVIGGKPDGTDWNVGIQTPFKPRGEYFGILCVSDKAVVTSGIYERYFEENGKTYHHIMDTKTGYPIDNELFSVTVVNDSSMAADALAKAFTMGLTDGMKFIESTKGAEAIFVTKDKKVYLTPGLKGKFKITDSNYKLY